MLLDQGGQSFCSDLDAYTASHFGEGKPYTETETDDGHSMRFYTITEGSSTSYSGIIDYTKDKGLIVDVFGKARPVAYGQVLATFSADEFLDICKSFAFVDEKA
jgi:hypothetical protein